MTTTPNPRLNRGQRAVLALSIVARYQQGASIRQLAEQEGRSYGWVHGLLREAGVELRGRGGARRKQSAPSPSAPTLKDPS